MSSDESWDLTFTAEVVSAKFIDPDGQLVQQPIEIRTNPLTGRTCRIAFSRTKEKETGTDNLPSPPPDAGDTENCPFCRPQVVSQTPRLNPDLSDEPRLSCEESLLFPNLFPYGSYSAVSLFNNDHFVEIGQATPSSYTSCFLNCCRYLARVMDYDPRAGRLEIKFIDRDNTPIRLVKARMVKALLTMPGGKQREFYFYNFQESRYYFWSYDYSERDSDRPKPNDAIFAKKSWLRNLSSFKLSVRIPLDGNDYELNYHYGRSHSI